MAASPDAQLRSLEIYAVLSELRSDWGGALILNIGLDETGCALSFAANIAGAVCLTLEADPQRARAALRVGACDFVVNTLDEALRAIKNEIRQRHPLSVGLEGDPTPILQEMLERGVVPQLFTSPSAAPAASFAAWGTRLLHLRATPPPHGWLDAAGFLVNLLEQRQYTQITRGFASAAELRAFDLRAAAILPTGDVLRRRWLDRAPRLFPRDRTRTLWLTREELSLLSGPQSP